MGSGATKVNSNESDPIKNDLQSSVTNHENNNNAGKPTFITDSSITSSSSLSKLSSNYKSNSKSNITKHKRPKSGQQDKLKKEKSSESLSIKKSITENNESSAYKNIPPETKVVSIKPCNLKVDEEEMKSSKDEIKRLNKELDSSESSKIDLQEQIQLLREELEKRKQSTDPIHNGDSLQETLNAKDQYIVKLEKELKSNQTEANKVRIKLKKKIKLLNNQLHESRQESSITQMELRAEIAKQTECIKRFEGQSGSLSSKHENDTNEDSHHSKIIVELSNQLSEQSEQISSLESELAGKKKEICDLKLALSDTNDIKDFSSIPNNASHGSLLPHTSTDRLHSSRGRRLPKTEDRLSRSSKNVEFSDNFIKNDQDQNNSLFFQTQSTALSDSDSDWGENPTPSQTHSAPPRSRIKSALSLASSGKHKGSLVTLNGNDDSLMELMSATPIEQPLEGKSYKSTLKHHLQKTKIDNEMNSLIGPALAFENKKPDPFSDTSCEPTPRPQRTVLHPNSKVRIVKPIVH